MSNTSTAAAGQLSNRWSALGWPFAVALVITVLVAFGLNSSGLLLMVPALILAWTALAAATWISGRWLSARASSLNILDDAWRLTYLAAPKQWTLRVPYTSDVSNARLSGESRVQFGFGTKPAERDSVFKLRSSGEKLPGALVDEFVAEFASTSVDPPVSPDFAVVITTLKLSNGLSREELRRLPLQTAS